MTLAPSLISEQLIKRTTSFHHLHLIDDDDDHHHHHHHHHHQQQHQWLYIPCKDRGRLTPEVL
jgi:hypothetical protein